MSDGLSRQASGRSLVSRRVLLVGMAAAAVPAAWVAWPRADAAELDLSGYRLTFEENFDDPTQLFPNDRFGTSYESWGGLRTLEPNGEQELYVDAAFLQSIGAPKELDPFRFVDGHLEIVAQPTPAAYLERIGKPYVSGLLTTDYRFAQKYGYFELEMEAPRGQGLWPAFWLVAQTQAEHLEIDAFEQLGHQPGIFYVSMHAPKRNMDFHQKRAFAFGSTPHRIGVKWLPDQIIWYVDRREVARTEAALDVPMYMLANLAVGGSWPGNPSASTTFPASFKLYSLRAYQRIGDAG